MNLRSISNPCRGSILGAAWLVLAGVPACESHAAAGTDAGLDDGLCAHPSSVRLAPYEMFGGGIVSSADVSASVCNVGIVLYRSPDNSAPDEVLMRLDGTNSTVDFQRPLGATRGGVNGFISVGTPMSGIYTSADAPIPCGALSFDYGLPVDPESTCDGGTSSNCPPGCAPACPPDLDASTCNACTPLLLSLGFQATQPSDCGGGTHEAMGSWTLRLTSVAPYQGDAGTPSTYYVAHGQLTANLVGTGPADAATLALAF